MPHNGRLDTDSLIESVVRITGQRDRETLEACLVTTLQALLGAGRVTLLRATVHGAEALASTRAGHRAAEGAAPTFPETLLDLLVELQGPTDLTDAGTGTSLTACPYATEHHSNEGWLVVEGAEPFTPHHSLIAGMAAIYGNYLSIIDATENDTLTGLRNRKTFEDRVGRLLASGQPGVPQSGAPAAGETERRHPDDHASHWLGMLDIDCFKRINDSYGHVFGDEVLLLFAQLMRGVFRHDDLLFRYGGEEFVVILAPITAEGAAAAFERFRRTVEAYEFPQIGRVTTSIGYVRVSDQFIPSEVVGHADEALYHAKRNGRNRVHRYETLVEDGLLGQSHPEGDIELF